MEKKEKKMTKPWIKTIGFFDYKYLLTISSSGIILEKRINNTDEWKTIFSWFKSYQQKKEEIKREYELKLDEKNKEND